MARKKMGEILLESQVITEKQLESALLRQQGSKKPLGQILEEMDIILEEDIAKALSKQFGFPYVKQFSRHRFPQSVLDKIDAETALTHHIFPLKIDDKTLYLAMANPLNMSLQSDLSFKLGVRISPCVATPEEIKAAIKKFYMPDLATSANDRGWDILLIDNQEISLTAAEAILKKEGYTVHKARNGAEGLKLAIQIKPNLIITDITLPRMDGVELFAALQKNSETSKIPVIACTGKSAAEDEYRLLDIGFYDFIAKPINPLRLQARVKRAMRWNHRA